MKAQMYNFSTWVSETDPDSMVRKYVSLLKKAGFGIENSVEKHFNPQGWTLLILLAESHFAIHTFPENGQAYLELSSCIKAQFDKFLRLYVEAEG